MARRKPSSFEMKLLHTLVKLADDIDSLPPDWDKNIQVEEMNDGGMGSLKLYLTTSTSGENKFGRSISEYEFDDIDEVKVIASLIIDSDGILYELDIWKTDFSRTAIIHN